jgi:lipoprotein-releasing system permease protein
MKRVVGFIALRQLWDRKLLNGIAVMGVSLGVLVLIGINGILKGFQSKFLDNILRISPHVTMFDKQLRAEPPLVARLFGPAQPVVARVFHESPSDRALRVQRPAEIVRALERTEGVVAASASLVGSAVLAYGSQQYPVDLRGIEPLAQEKVTPISQYLLRGDHRAFAGASDGILLGEGVARKLGAKLGDQLVASSSLGKRLVLKVMGIFEVGIPPVDGSRAYVTLKNAQDLLGRPDTVARIEIRLDDTEKADAVSARVERMFGYDAEGWREQNANFLSLFAMQNMITSMVVAAILAVGGFGILAIQIMIVLQKTRDIAILRSVGYRRSDILGCFLLQGAIIALVGGILGDVGGHYLIKFLATLKTPQEALVKSDTFLVADDPRFYVYGTLFALLVGLVASVIPAVRAARVEPVDVLRGQIG